MKAFFRSLFTPETRGGTLLILAAVLAMVLANSPWAEYYARWLETPLVVQAGPLLVDKPWLAWVNDGLMAIFFLLIGIEVKHEMVSGALSSPKKAVLPVIAALGGMLAPALVFLIFNMGDPINRQGWAIPAATDIAFAVGVLALLGKRVPPALKIFLLALAIIDDLGVIIIIALFYTSELSTLSLAVAGGAIVALVALNLLNVRRLLPYLLVGAVLWVSVLKSGVHATLAGVIIGFLIPHKIGNDKPAHRLERMLSDYTALLILPLFALANAGVSLKGLSLDSLLAPLPLGIMLGLFVGKPLGVFSATWLAVKGGMASLPENTNWRQIFALAVLCGIGFTMSMFIASLAYQHEHVMYDTYSRLGILAGSTIAAVAGYWLMKRSLAPAKEEVT
ncbi:Na+/H+ antiporter NhaA [Gallaecimonas pentaromativorans]|uniref:Na(+)/H(+) antiporter NhaA n=1 Tax=Gallaecimonas pentaromativorans TaxID=584787 RepID=A0A3N1P2T3_9GAMM|nr:Na+/H+ antiporter NhaA [Gallaecimonas pentaromativorans]MED5523965.1 Na+/H+ antiporter NhaA [Pseudomonadota bacterium]ROQ22389.1 sodium/proton antiporter (NhaA family) [Gallaecimonas pentaromativorans]